MTTKTAILYASPAQDAFIVDVPTSISLAQGDGFKSVLLSREALKEPWQANEPKTEKAKTSLQSQVSEVSVVYELTIREALENIKISHSGPWCLGRFCQDNVDDFPEDFFSSILLPTSSRSVPLFQVPSVSTIRLPLSMIPSYTNETACTQSIVIKPSSKPAQTFCVPPLSTFSLTTLPPAPPSTSQFNLVLLDPPWPNRSVRRSTKYGTPSTTSEVLALLTALELQDFLAANGIMAIWITNRPAVRKELLDLVHDLGMHLVEEWIWIKTTESGEPLLPLNVLWRKPYEVLLVFRKIDADIMEQKVKRRVIAGVPDLHSRKPCLKELFELLLGLSKDYDALEVFARHLTVGWHAWGNEVLRFNWEKNWLETES